jgi:hypothetical protein
MAAAVAPGMRGARQPQHRFRQRRQAAIDRLLPAALAFEELPQTTHLGDKSVEIAVFVAVAAEFQLTAELREIAADALKMPPDIATGIRRKAVVLGHCKPPQASVNDRYRQTIRYGTEV